MVVVDERAEVERRPLAFNHCYQWCLNAEVKGMQSTQGRYVRAAQRVTCRYEVVAA